MRPMPCHWRLLCRWGEVEMPFALKKRRCNVLLAVPGPHTQFVLLLFISCILLNNIHVHARSVAETRIQQP